MELSAATLKGRAMEKHYIAIAEASGDGHGWWISFPGLRVWYRRRTARDRSLGRHGTLWRRRPRQARHCSQRSRMPGSHHMTCRVSATRWC
jgi:hypothetical protein